MERMADAHPRIRIWRSSYYYPCPSSNGWQDYFSQLAAETTSLLNVDGIYYDQYGFGYLTNYYGCYNPLHEHPIIEGSVSSNYMGIGETQMLEKTRNKVGNEKAIYRRDAYRCFYTVFGW